MSGLLLLQGNIWVERRHALFIKTLLSPILWERISISWRTNLSISNNILDLYRFYLSCTYTFWMLLECISILSWATKCLLRDFNAYYYNICTVHDMHNDCCHSPEEDPSPESHVHPDSVTSFSWPFLSLFPTPRCFQRTQCISDQLTGQTLHPPSLLWKCT